METRTTANRYTDNMTTITKLISAVTKARTAEAKASLARREAVQAFTQRVKDTMQANYLDGGTIRRRLGWPDSRLSNLLHLGHSLTDEHMAQLASALGPMTAEERKATKWQPVRSKIYTA